jgi:ABC-type arginine transport system ATPase subunit
MVVIKTFDVEIGVPTTTNVVYQEVGHISKWDSFAIFANFCQP